MEFSRIAGGRSSLRTDSTPPSPLWPGLVVTAIGAGLAVVVAARLPAVSALTVAVALGAGLRNLGLLPASVIAAVTRVSKGVLRAGVVLLGLQLAVPDVLALGGGELVTIVATMAVTFGSTLLLGRALGVGRDVRLLVATGFSICGASAVAAMNSVVDADDDDVALPIALVTVFGSLAIVGMPLLRPLSGFDDATYGVWVGASVHEVAQVVAAASAVSGGALAVAVVAKLARVVLLAPVVAGAGIVRRNAAEAGAGRRPPILPLFVLGFLAAVGVRSTGTLPEPLVDTAGTVSTVLLAGALFGLGVGVHLPTLVRTGGRAVVLGALSTVVAVLVSWAGLVMLG